jgi:hypothetical protein
MAKVKCHAGAGLHGMNVLDCVDLNLGAERSNQGVTVFFYVPGQLLS